MSSVTVSYRLALLKETVSIALILIALRLHIITANEEQRTRLRQRRDFVREQIARIRSDNT